MRELEGWLRCAPQEIFFASELTAFSRGGNVYQRRLWQMDRRDIDVVRVRSLPIEVNCLRGIKFYEWIRRGVDWYEAASNIREQNADPYVNLRR